MLTIADFSKDLSGSLDLATTQPARQKVQNNIFWLHSCRCVLSSFGVRESARCCFAKPCFQLHLRTFWCSWEVTRSIDWVFEVTFCTNFRTPTSSVIGVYESVVVIWDFARYKRWVFIECYKDELFCPTARWRGVFLNDVKSKVVSKRAVSIHG